MKIVKTASGKQNIKISKKEWTNIGKKAGWMKKAEVSHTCDYCGEEHDEGEMHELKKNKWCCDKCIDKKDDKSKDLESKTSKK